MIKEIVVSAALAFCFAGCERPVEEKVHNPALDHTIKTPQIPKKSLSPTELLIYQARELIEHGSKDSAENPYKKMIALLEEALDRDPGDDRLYFQLARLYCLPATFGGEEVKLTEAMPRARQMFEKAIEINPGNIESLSEFASFLSANGSNEDKSTVNELLSKVIEAEPDKLSTYFDLANNLNLMKDNAQSLAVLLKAEKKIRNSPNIDNQILMSYHDLGSQYRETKEYAQAESILKSGAKLANNTGDHLAQAQILAELGRVYTELGDFGRAEKIFNDSAQTMKSLGIEEESYWGCLYHALGALYAEMERGKQACETYLESANKEADNYIRQFEASLACFISGDNAKALKYIERSLQAQEKRQIPDVRIKIIKGFVLLGENRSDDAQTIFEEMKEYRNGAGAHVGLGRIHLAASRLPEAHKHLKIGLDLVQKRGMIIPRTGIQKEYKRLILQQAMLSLGWVSALEEKHTEALRYFNGALEIRPKNVAALLAKGNTLGRLKRYDEAQATINQVLESDPNNSRALSELALLHFNIGDLEKAESYFAMARDIGDQDYTCPYEGLGLVYLRQGRVEEAKANLEKAIELNPDVEYKKFNALAKIYLKEGKRKKAKELLEKSIANNPHDNGARKLLASEFKIVSK